MSNAVFGFCSQSAHRLGTLYYHGHLTKKFYARNISKSRKFQMLWDLVLELAELGNVPLMTDNDWSRMYMYMRASFD